MRQPGLRFDIYERIMLNDEAESIRELDGVELIPHIEVAVEGDQAVVKGYLQLEGSYSCDDESRSSVPLQHTIPVEITLPMNRVSSVDQIAVEIDNFDVDLLSSRSLNVTGVLSLQGIEMYSNTPANDWREEEEVLFVHQAEPEAEEEQLEQEALNEDPPPESASPWLLRVPAAAYQQQEPQASLTVAPSAYEPEEEQPYEAASRVNEYAPEHLYTSSVAQPAVYQSPGNILAEGVAVSAAPKPREEILVDTYEDLTLLDQYEIVTEQEVEDKDSWMTDQTDQDDDDEDEDDRDKAMKIAFGSKRSEESQSVEFRSYLHKNDNYRKASNEAPSNADDNRIAAEEQNPADVLEWKKLFISGSEEQKFKKVKMVIVQKEETLETIAKRYDRKPQEIKLYNRLQELDLSAGQVIYIP